MLTCLRWDLCISKGAACAVERGREQTKSACIDTKKSTATIQQGAGRCLVLRMECKTSALSSRRGGLVPCVSLALSPEGQCWPWALQSYICQMGRWGEGSDQAGLSRAHHLPSPQAAKSSPVMGLCLFSCSCKAPAYGREGEKKSCRSRPLTSVSLQICPETYLTEYLRAWNILSKAERCNKWLAEYQLPCTMLLKGNML